MKRELLGALGIWFLSAVALGQEASSVGSCGLDVGRVMNTQTLGYTERKTRLWR